MTLTLTPEAEAHLAAAAARRGLPPEDTLAQLLAEEDHRSAEWDAAVADVQSSLDDFAAGRSLSLEEYGAQANAR